MLELRNTTKSLATGWRKKIPKKDGLKKAKRTVSLYLHHFTPKGAQLSAKRTPCQPAISPIGESENKVSTPLLQPCDTQTKRLTSVLPHTKH